MRHAGRPPAIGAASRASSCPFAQARSFHVAGVFAAVGSCTLDAVQAASGCGSGIGTG